jgi:hypothetical protein
VQARAGSHRDLPAPSIVAHVVQLVDEVGHFGEHREEAREPGARDALRHHQRHFGCARRFVEHRLHERARVGGRAQPLGVGEEALDGRGNALAVARGQPSQAGDVRAELAVERPVAAHGAHDRLAERGARLRVVDGIDVAVDRLEHADQIDELARQLGVDDDAELRRQRPKVARQCLVLRAHRHRHP